MILKMIQVSVVVVCAIISMLIHIHQLVGPLWAILFGVCVTVLALWKEGE